MGTKRESIESKIISYFHFEDLEKIELLFGIVKGIVAKRAPKKQKQPPKLHKPRAEPDIPKDLGQLKEIDSKAS